MRYPITFRCDEHGWSAVFPDLPEITIVRESKEEILSIAHNALYILFASYFNKKRIIPEPSATGFDFIDVPAGITAKILLLNALTFTGTTQSRLAKKMNINPQDVHRFINFNYPTKIDTVEKVLMALGYHMILGAIRE